MFMDQAPATPCRYALIADEIAAAADAHAAPKRLGGFNQTASHARPAIRRGASVGAHRLAPRSHLGN